MRRAHLHRKCCIRKRATASVAQALYFYKPGYEPPGGPILAVLPEVDVYIRSNWIRSTARCGAAQLLPA